MRTYDECYFLNYDDYDDIQLLEVGCQRCLPNYDFGPIVRENFVLHYIIDGKGKLFLNGKAFNVKSGEAFVTYPGVTAYYQADSISPWNYIWLHFNGSKSIEFMNSLNLNDDSPIFKKGTQHKVIFDIVYDILHNHEEELLCIGNMYCLLNAMQKQVRQKNNKLSQEPTLKLMYIRKAIEYIQRKYADPIKVTDIADYCCLNRSYLTKIFKHATGYSPQEYLIHYRIIKAKNILRENNESIGYVAYSVGYSDPLAFSKMFKSKVGVSPADYYEYYLTSKEYQQI